MVALVVALMTGLVRWPWAWLPMGLLFVVVPSQIAWQLTPAGQRARLPVALAMLAGLAVGLVATAVAPLSVAELRKIERRFVLPDTWKQTAERATGGPLCLDQCPTVTWEWEVPSPAPAVVPDAVAVLRSEGFRVVVSSTDGRTATLDATSGRVRVGGAVAADAGEDTTTVRFSLTTR